MATYYARNVTGTWAANTSWDSASSAGSGPAGPPIAGDTAVFDSGFTGNVSVAANAACTVLTAQAGATGTLTIDTAKTLTVAGDITWVTGFHVAGAGILAMSAAGTLTSAGLGGTLSLQSLGSGNKTFDTAGTTWVSVYASSAHTITLASALTCTTLELTSGYITFAGAYDITCGTWIGPVASGTTTLVSGQTITVSTALRLMALIGAGTPAASQKIVASTASSPVNLVYNGTVAECKVSGYGFTDVAYSGSAVTNLDNWYGGTLTRTSGITNRTSADIGGGTGGVTGRCLQLGVGVC